MKVGIDKSITTVGDFNTHLSVINRISQQILNKDVEDMNNTLNQLDLIDIYRILYPTVAEYTFLFSNAH